MPLILHAPLSYRVHSGAQGGKTIGTIIFCIKFIHNNVHLSLYLLMYSTVDRSGFTLFYFIFIGPVKKIEQIVPFNQLPLENQVHVTKALN